MNNRVVSEWASECNEWITEWMTMNVACLPRTVHTRIEFPKEHVFNFHARIILNGGKTVERDNKTGKKKKHLQQKQYCCYFVVQPAAASVDSGHRAMALTMWPPPLPPLPLPTSSPLGSNTQVSSSSSCRCIAFFSCRCLFSKGYSKLVKRLASSNKKMKQQNTLKLSKNKNNRPSKF